MACAKPGASRRQPSARAKDIQANATPEQDQKSRCLVWAAGHHSDRSIGPQSVPH